MELIDKAAVVAEIERMFNEVKESTRESDTGTFYAMKHLRSFLDTLKVKEVDLEKEIDKMWNPRFSLGWDDKSLLSINHKGFKIIAKHFFELGLKAQTTTIYKPIEKDVYKLKLKAQKGE